jgi:hypothetical protein
MTQSLALTYTAPHFTIGSKGKISLKNVIKTMNISKYNENSTDCNSLSRATEKKSIKELLSLSNIKQLTSQNCISLKYEDIRYIEQNPKPLFPAIFCFDKK